MMVQLDPHQLLVFLPQFRDHLKQLQQNDLPTDQEHLSLLISFLETEYAATLQQVKTLTSHGEITFDLLWSIFLPSSVIFTLCETTSEPRAVRLREISLSRCCMVHNPYWELDCEYVDGNDDSPGQIWEFAAITLKISHFEGVQKITDLNAYPMEKHLNAGEVKTEIVRRGRRWLRLSGVYHMHYNGMAYRNSAKVKVCPNFNNSLQAGQLTVRTPQVDGRIMIDRRKMVTVYATYCRLIFLCQEPLSMLNRIMCVGPHAEILSGIF